MRPSHSFPIRCLTVAAVASTLASCVVPPLAERAAKYSPQQVDQFVLNEIAFGHQSNGQPDVMARFNALSTSRLLIPRDKLSLFCTQKGGSFKVEAVNKINPIAGTRVPPPNAQNSGEERTCGRQRLLAAFEQANQDGAFGRYLCSHAADGRLLWTVWVTPGVFEPEDPNNMLVTNGVQMLMRTQLGPAPAAPTAAKL